MNRRLLVFSLMTCVFSWACWIPIIDNLGPSPFDSSTGVLLLFFLGAYGPTLVGIILTFHYEKGKGLKLLFKRALMLKVGLPWLLISLLAGPILYAVSVALYAAFGGEVGSVNYGLLPWIPVVFVVPIIFGPLAEEFGWRGVALPLLDHKDKPVAASIVIGFIWALWHAPLFWAETGTAISGFPVDVQLISLFFLAVIGSSFIYTWLFNRTLGSLGIAILLHLGMNSSGTITGMLFPDMSLAHKLELYKFYVVAVWIVVLVGALFQFKRTGALKSTSGK